MIIHCLGHISRYIEPFPLIHNGIDDMKRPPPLIVMVNLVTIQCHTARDYMDVVVVSVVMAIDQQGLPFILIAHFSKIFMRYLHKLRKRELMSLTGDCYMKLCVLDALITAGVGHEIPLKVFRRIIITKSEHVEVCHLQQLCFPLRYFLLIILHSMKGRAGNQNGCNHDFIIL